MVQLSKATQGHERINLTGIWNDLPKRTQVVSIGKWLIFIAIVLLLLEVLERRTGLLSRGWWRLLSLRVRARLLMRESITKEVFEPVKEKKVVEKPTAKPEAPVKAAAAKEKTGAEGLLSAFSKAQRSAKARTDRKK
jgi:hypothetical protein